jgi:hypothetical protein
MPSDHQRKGSTSMRFVMLMIPKGYESAAPGTMPEAKAVEAMMKCNKSLKEAGVLFDQSRWIFVLRHSP